MTSKKRHWTKPIPPSGKARADSGKTDGPRGPRGGRTTVSADGKLVRKTVYVDWDVSEALRAEAYHCGSSEAAVVREELWKRYHPRIQARGDGVEPRPPKSEADARELAERVEELRHEEPPVSEEPRGPEGGATTTAAGGLLVRKTFSVECHLAEDLGREAFDKHEKEAVILREQLRARYGFE